MVNKEQLPKAKQVIKQIIENLTEQHEPKRKPEIISGALIGLLFPM